MRVTMTALQGMSGEPEEPTTNNAKLREGSAFSMPALPILTFHALDEMPPSVVSLPPGLFAKSMRSLYESGYRTISLMDAVDCLRRRIPFPARAFVLTFDDGYQSVFSRAFPILQRYGFTTMVFLTVGKKERPAPGSRLFSFEGREMLNWEEIREMQRGGIAFAAHTLTHPDLTRIRPDRLRSEICDSKEAIEDALGTPIVAFSYPYGRYDRRAYAVVQENFDCACTDRLGLLKAKSNPYVLDRVDAYCLRNEWGFGLISTPFLAAYLGAYRILRSARMALHSHRRPEDHY
jgi:peptidoglycan/xylan/chitin deacetylase (PgdA/CDA1 family)